MWQMLFPARTHPDLLALQINAERAGAALACPFSSSDEFEAAVIRSKRRAGVYGPRRHRRHVACGAIAVVALAALLLLI